MKVQFSRVPPSADGGFRYFCPKKSNQKSPLKSADSSDYVLAKTKVSVARLRSADAAEAHFLSTSAEYQRYIFVTLTNFLYRPLAR